MKNEIILHFFISRNIIERFSVGCDKVNCGNAAREGALGYDLGAPHLTIGTIYLVGEHSVLPRNVKSNVLRAHDVRPYGIPCADGLHGAPRSAHPTAERMQYPKHSETTEMIPQ